VFDYSIALTVAQLYRGLFKLLLAHGCTETAPNSLEQKLNSEQLQASGTGILKDGVESKLQRNIEREVAAALESTFPQVGVVSVEEAQHTLPSPNSSLIQHSV